MTYEKYMERSSGVDGGCMGPAVPVVCLSIPSAREDMAGGPRAVVPGTGESGAEVLLPAGLGSCTGLYVAVRGIGGGGAGAHVHIDDSVRAEGAVRGTCGCRKRVPPGRMRRGGHRVSARAWWLVAGLRAGGRAMIFGLRA